MKTIHKKNTTRIINGNLFDYIKNIPRCGNNGSTVIVPHVCNNVSVFGSGFALSIKQKYPDVATNFELLGKNTRLGYVQYINTYKDPKYFHELIFANMIAQNGLISKNNPRPLNYEALVRSMIDIRNFINNLDKEKVEIHCPKFGSGLAGGNWNFIYNLIEDIWSSFNISIYSYQEK